MSTDLIKDVFLVILGGIITFIVTLILDKIQRREEKIEWIKLPNISISSQDISVLNWIKYRQEKR